jgi:glycosyltransferase involved in cell wall biosynthesis
VSATNAAVPAGINVGGYLRTESGMGSAVRGYLRALRSLSVPVALKDLSAVSGNRAEDRTVTAFDADHPHDVNLVCGDVEHHFAILSHLGKEFFRGRYNVALWAWELPRFPERWYDRFAYYDEIWVPSSFIANALAPVSPIPVVRVPPVLTPEDRGSRDRGRRRLGAAPGEYVYLFVFDFHSRFQRKNPLGVIDAFKRAFAPAEPARLVIKCVNADFDREHFAALGAAAEGYPITIHDGYWPAQDVRDLTAACDCYVSLHRSEGVGLTITDAMALGKPVIATGWSGNMDFMNVSNSYPVRYDLVEIGRHAGQYRAGETWAEPSAAHAAELMRRVYENREEAQVRGRAAEREIAAHYAEESVAAVIRERLTVIGNSRRFSALRRSLQAPISDLDSFLADYRDISPYVPGHHLRYQRLLCQIEDVVREALPADATVAVISRGDPDLLRLAGRTGWHFPQTDEGVYAGHNPANSAAAIAHLEAVRARGARYLLFPSTAFWWLEHYAELGKYLEGRYRTVAHLPDVCTIFGLSDKE